MSQTAERALDLLERVAAGPSPLGLMELAAETGIDKSTAARLLGFLERREMLVREPVTKKYAVGAGLIALSTRVLNGLDLQRLALPELIALRDATGETTNLHIRRGDDALCIAGVESAQDVRRVLPLGEQRPLSVGPAAKTILAFLPEEQVAAIVGDLPDRSQRQKVLDQLGSIRKERFIAVVGDRTAGVGALSVPVFDQAGVVASITVAGPADRWTLPRMRAAAPNVRAAADRLTRALRGSE